ncbi:MAG: secretion system protein E, partial [Methanomicrobium sp.]|nr:secretion system protein E [Methanomicrobium sp.]
PPSMFGALNLMIIQQLQYVNKRMARRCIFIAETFVKKNYIDYNILYKWQPATDTFEKIYRDSRVLKEIAYSQGWTDGQVREEIDKRKEILLGLLQHRIRDSDHITTVFDEFSKNGHYEFD